MAPGRPQIFLQPDTYRRRRLIDAVRLLPIFGGFLLIVPMLLVPEGETNATGPALIYLFGLWTLLIVLAAMIAKRLQGYSRGTGTQQTGERTGAEDDGGS